MSERRLIAIDPSLTCSGWALFSVKSNRLIGVGKIKSLPAEHALATRLQDLQSKISKTLAMYNLGSVDTLICEAPTTMRDPRAAFKVEQVRSIFEAVGRDRGILVPGRINPRSVQHEVMGLKGKQLERTIVKATAVHTVRTLYGDVLASFGFDVTQKNLQRNQDIVDAILLGSLGLVWLNSAEIAGLDPERYFEATRYATKRRALQR
jgi:Holliday junction resolvasome RuvABC endonuclease subunit